MAWSFWEDYFHQDPTYGLQHAVDWVVSELPDEFRLFWGLDSERKPEHLDEDAWREYRSMAWLVERLAFGASNLVRPRKTSEQEMSLYDWLNEEAGQRQEKLDELLQIVREEESTEAWWKISKALRPMDPADPRTKRAFLHNCMQFRAAEMYPWEPNSYASRLFTLLEYVIHKPTQRCRQYLPRVAECYVRGMDIELAVMARAVLDAVLQDLFSDDEVRKEVGAEGKVGLERRIQCAVSKGAFDRDTGRAATSIRETGNGAAHADLGLEIDPDETLAALYRCLEAMDDYSP